MSRRGVSRPSMSLAPPLESQDVSRYQATDPTYWGEKNPPLSARRTVHYSLVIIGVILFWSVVMSLGYEVCQWAIR